jgi:hypothetical protein
VTGNVLWSVGLLAGDRRGLRTSQAAGQGPAPSEPARPHRTNPARSRAEGLTGLTLYLLNVQAKPRQHHADCEEGYSQPRSAIVAFQHGLLASLQVLGGDFQTGLNILIHQIRPEAMDRNSSLGQRITCLILSKPSLAHLHARRLGDAENLVRALDGRVQFAQAAQQSCPSLITFVTAGMTPHADGIGTRAKIRVRWNPDAMIAMAHDASRKRSRVKGPLVRTFFVHLGLESVTVRAHILNFVYSGRGGAVVSMACCTCWRTQIASHRERLVVHARAVLGELIRGDGISLHVTRIGMAAGAGVRHVNRVHGGTGIAGRS